MAKFQLRTVSGEDHFAMAQQMEDDRLRQHLRDAAANVKTFCERLIAETDSTEPLADLRMDLSGLSTPLIELLQCAGAVSLLHRTRIADRDPAPLQCERVPSPAARKPAARKPAARKWPTAHQPAASRPERGRVRSAATNEARAAALRTAMKDAGIDAVDIAARSGLPVETVELYTEGRFPGFTSEWCSLAKALGLNGWELMDGKIVAAAPAQPPAADG